MQKMLRFGCVLVALLVCRSAQGEASKPITAVFNVQTQRIKLDQKYLGTLADFIGAKLAASGKFQVVPRAQAMELKKRAGCQDEDCLLELGKALAAQKLVSATVSAVGARCLITLSLYDLRTMTFDQAAAQRSDCAKEHLLLSLQKALDQLSRRAQQAQSAERDPTKMIPVPSGEFVMGSSKREVMVASFMIDRTEVSVDQYRRCVDASACSPPKKGWACTFGMPGHGRHPVTCVSWIQAEAYCKWAGKRLPTGVEWEKAARGTDGRKYPWGNEDVGLRRANLRNIKDGYKLTAPVGSFPEGASPYGVLNMGGNVREWIADWRTQYETRTVRGGSWSSEAGAARTTALTWGSPTFQDASFGFRCARSGGTP